MANTHSFTELRDAVQRAKDFADREGQYLYVEVDAWGLRFQFVKKVERDKYAVIIPWIELENALSISDLIKAIAEPAIINFKEDRV